MRKKARRTKTKEPDLESAQVVVRFNWRGGSSSGKESSLIPMKAVRCKETGATFFQLAFCDGCIESFTVIPARRTMQDVKGQIKDANRIANYGSNPH